MRLLDVIAVLMWLQVVPLSAQIGRDCSSTRACMPHQTCYFGYCSCDRGFVRSDRSCFPVRKYGETCFFDVQCVDHRMTCKPENSSLPSLQLCLCDRFHEWNESLQECIQAMNVSEIMTALEVTNPIGSIEEEAHSIFAWIVAAGLTVAALLGIISVTCIFYGCCLYECYDFCTRDYPDMESGRVRCPPSCQYYQRTQ